MWDFREVSLENLNRFMVEVDGCESLESGPFQPEAEAAAAAEEIEECGLGWHGIFRKRLSDHSYFKRVRFVQAIHPAGHGF